MIDFNTVKLGKKEPRLDKNRLRLAKYLPEGAPLPEVDYTGGVTDWGMMLNDQLGDCTIAGCGHAIQVWSLARKGEYTLPDEAILQKYEQWCGYDPAIPSSDQGGDEVSVLNHWRRTPFWSHQIIGYADPDPANLGHVMRAIELFGVVYIGVNLPLTAQGSNTWGLVGGPGSEPGSWGGHAVVVPKYRIVDGKVVFTCISWGGLIDITQNFWLYNHPKLGPYIDEVHAIVSPEFLSLKTGRSPEGFDLAALEADLPSIEN